MKRAHVGPTPLLALRRASYTEQLTWLEKQVSFYRGLQPLRVELLLSLAESVKEARDHHLNCPKELP